MSDNGDLVQKTLKRIAANNNDDVRLIDESRVEYEKLRRIGIEAIRIFGADDSSEVAFNRVTSMKARGESGYCPFCNQPLDSTNTCTNDACKAKGTTFPLKSGAIRQFRQSLCEFYQWLTPVTKQILEEAKDETKLLKSMLAVEVGANDLREKLGIELRISGTAHTVPIDALAKARQLGEAEATLKHSELKLAFYERRQAAYNILTKVIDKLCLWPEKKPVIYADENGNVPGVVARNAIVVVP